MIKTHIILKMFEEKEDTINKDSTKMTSVDPGNRSLRTRDKTDF